MTPASTTAPSADPSTPGPAAAATRRDGVTPATTARRDGSTRTPAVQVDGLTKRFGRRTVVDDMTFTVPTGAVAGLVGPNGAGKTTIMAMLLGLVKPSSGSGTVLGHPLDEPVRYGRHVGSLIEGPAFHPGVSGTDNLRSLAILGGHPTETVADLIELVGLRGRGDDRYGTYSLGMKQRLGIAAALLGDPRLVVLDEPTNGLDPAGMQDIRRLIREIAAGGRTLIVSSHLLGELEQVCDWLVVIDHGGLLHLGPPETLAGASDTLVLRAEDPARLDELGAIVRSERLITRVAGPELLVTLDASADAPALAAQINRRAHTAGIALCEVHHRRADLEARYLHLIAANPATTGDDR